MSINHKINIIKNNKIIYINDIIYDIPYEDIQIFLLANNRNFKDKNRAYDIAIELLKDKNSKGHTTSIIEWMMAHNLLINNINIPIYTIDKIDNMSQVEINKLSKLLTMKGNNRNNIKNILRYLNKLNDENITLLPEINDIILKNFNQLEQLEIQSIDIANLKYSDVINLLKTHRNKKAIRKFVSDNLEKIIVYNIYNIFNLYFKGDYYKMNDILYIVNIYNKNIISDIIMDNKEQLKKSYSDKEINDTIKEIKANNDDWEEVDIGINGKYKLVEFTFNLIINKEIGLAKKILDISNQLHYFGRSYNYNYDLVDRLFLDDIDVFGAVESVGLETIINFMGEDEFFRVFKENLGEEDLPDIYEFSKKLLKLKKYNLLIKIIQIYVDINYGSKEKIIYKTLQSLIKSKNDDLILKYIKKHGI